MRKMANFQIIVFVVISVSCFCHISHVAASTEYNRYLAHIFQKYGNGGTMTFEGLEHLMYSLGLGQIEFDDMHTLDEHRPKDFKINPSTNELDLMKTIKILPDDENDVQVIENIIKENNKTIANNNNNTASAASNDNEKESDDSNKNLNQINKNINNEFKEMHDPKHRHPRQNDATFDGPPLSGNVCLSPKSLLRLVVDHDDLHKRNLYRTSSTQTHSIKQQMDTHDDEEEYNEFINNVRLTPMAFMKLCPALLAQIDQQVCMQQAPHRHMEDPQTMIWNAWIYASASIFILSACGLLGILLVPLMKTVAYQEILNFLIAVAVGTLSGDALMHLLPHALVNEHAAGASEEHSHEKESNDHTHDNTAVWICACAFFTALFMYIIENLLPLLKGSGGEEHSHHGHSHQHHHHHHDQQSSEQKVPKQQQNEPNALESAATASPAMRELNIMLNETKLDKKKPSRPLTPVAFMVVIGDGLHNLTDGLAIGAAFAADPVTGLATAFAVLCHELPHELGDFALLLQTGVSIKRAICLNIVSSVLSFLGMAIGLLIANLHTNMTQWIYAGTAGSFLYIAFADLVPAMSAESRNKPKTAIIQILGIITGGLIMLAIAVNEDDLEKLFK